MSEPYSVLARRLLENMQRLPAPPSPSGILRNPQAGVRRLLMNCSLHVRPFEVVIAPGRDADTLVMLGNEPVPAAVAGSGYAAPSVSLGSFKFETSKWAGCYWCRARDNPARRITGAFWHCTVCAGYNCPGSGTAPLRCQCGNVATSFVTQETFEVMGAGIVATTPPRLAPPAVMPPRFVASPVAAPPRLPPVPAPPRVPAVAAPRPSAPSTALRLTGKR